MPTLCEIIKDNAKHSAEALIEIEVDTAFSWVTISCGDMEYISEDIFLQGHEAEQFIDEARRLYDEAQHVTMPEVYAHLAGPYAEAFCN